MAQEVEFVVESVVRGHHVYKDIWTPVVGKELVVLPEAGTSTINAVAVIRGDEIVRHVPRELSGILYYFLKHSGEISCVISGRRKHGVGLEVPCVYKMWKVQIY